MIFAYETWVLFFAALVVLVILLSSIYSIGPTQVGLGAKAIRIQTARRQPSGVPWGGGVPGGDADARSPLQTLLGFRGDQTTLGTGGQALTAAEQNAEKTALWRRLSCAVIAR